ncbi:MAG: M23 family metallopeptidase [Calditrichaceae bacterium]|nr:M23 family metallopeptidase [Calditrichia bacterium]NUQ41232.1 M23 family metallopeptidase [Calditrichaceae bacterium]
MRMFYTRFAFSFVMLFITLANAQLYLWPTDASKLMTSSFCEFRPRHYHAAIDIKTWQQTGYKIFAVEDGYVYRLRVASTGYGKTVYLKLRDGNFAVYAHLDGFTPALSAYTDSLRLAARNNVLDTYPEAGRFPVRRGDLLGYTGDTGIGVPHLHFELRDAGQNPIHPLQYYPGVIQDDIPPRAQFLAVIPAGGSTLINFEPDTLILPASQTPRVTLKKPLYLAGKAYLALRTHDQANGNDNLFDFYRAEMLVNGETVYRVQYDRFSYDETRLIEIDKSFSLWRKGLRVYHNFYRHPANTLPFYKNTARGDGMLSGKILKEGKNTVLLRVYDYAGNLLEVEIPLVYYRLIPVETSEAQLAGGAVNLELNSPEPLQNFEVYRVAYQSPSQTTPVTGFQVEASEGLLGLRRYYRFSIPHRAGNGTVAYQIRATYGDSLPILPVYVFPDGVNQQRAKTQDWSMVFYGDKAVVKGRGYAPAVLPEEEWLFYAQYKPEAYLLTFPLEDAGELKTGLGDAADSLLRQEIARWTPVYPGRERTVRSEDRALALHFPADAAYDTLYVRIQKFPAREKPSAAYPFKSAIYEASPFDQPFNYGANLSFALPDTLASRRGIGIYYFDRRRGWLYLPSRLDAGSNTLNARVTSMEKFALIQDTVPPEIRPLNLTEFNASASPRPLRFSVKDGMSGIYNETQISVEIDGKWSLFEFDPEEDRVIIPPRYIPRGEHTLKLIVTDNAGNRAYKEFTVRRNGNGKQ